jgi:hypothetical protein
MTDQKSTKEINVILPNKEDMLKRLIEVDDNGHYQEKFYPLLLQKAGIELYPSGVLLMITLAMYDYCKGLPAMTANLVMMTTPKFLEALITDEEALKEAVKLYEKTMQV